jgi:sugar phosphate isomerase/epimerase/type 1 glutamine amidotransferase
VKRLIICVSLAAVSLATCASLFAQEQNLTDPAERAKVDAALPGKAIVQPKKARKLLIFDLNVNYGGHRSIPYANYAFTRMGEKTGAWTATVTRDPSVFRRETLKQFDAVFFNNTVGNQFEDPALRQSLVEFVTGGGGLLGVHGTTVGFTRWPGAVEDFPEFGLMIGARGADHREPDERAFVQLDEPGHPLTAPFEGKGFEYRDEFFRVGEPYSRNRVRVLFSIDDEKTDAARPAGARPARQFRADGDHALAWVRNYGRGRTFYCTIGHNPSVFYDTRMLRFYLGAIQFALGDLDAPTVPSAKATPAVRAQEKLGWRLGVEAYTFHKFTFFETIDRTAKLGLPYVGGLSFQKVSAEIPKNLEPGLSDEELRRVRFKLDGAGLRLLTYYIHDIPADETAARKIFEFGRKMGIETFLSEPKVEALDTIERLCEEYGISVALHNHDRKASPQYWHPKEIMKLVEGRSKRLGACGDLGYWMRDGIDPVEAARILGDRLITVQVHDLNALTKEGQDVPWGTGVGKTEAFVREVHRLGVRPTMWGLEYSHKFEGNVAEVAKCAEFFNRLSMELAE